jgi:hypothetical protein
MAHWLLASPHFASLTPTHHANKTAVMPQFIPRAIMKSEVHGQYSQMPQVVTVTQHADTAVLLPTNIQDTLFDPERKTGFLTGLC